MNPIIRKPHHNHSSTISSQLHRSTSSCAACKFLKRRCVPTCIFAPYFRSDEPRKFAKVHKVFGASNVSKILFEVPEEQREDTVNSLAFEAEARLRDPVYGCIGAIALLQRRMFELQHDLALARARLARYAATSSSMTNMDGRLTAAGGCDGNCCTSYNIPAGVNNESVLPLVVGSGVGGTTSLEDQCWGFNNEDVAAGVLYSTTSCGGNSFTGAQLSGTTLVLSAELRDNNNDDQGLVAPDSSIQGWS